MCITTYHYQSDTKSNPNPNHNPNHRPTTKQHTIVNIHLNKVTCPTYPDKFIRNMSLHGAPSVWLQVVIVTPPAATVCLILIVSKYSVKCCRFVSAVAFCVYISTPHRTYTVFPVWKLKLTFYNEQCIDRKRMLRIGCVVCRRKCV